MEFWRFSLYNPFRTSWDSGWRTLDTDVYTERQIYYDTRSHFKIGLSLTYTFNYGKKVSQGNEVGEQNSGESAILKN